MLQDVVNNKETHVGKPEICAEIAERTGLPQKIVSQFYDAYHNVVMEAVADNAKVIIRRFGTIATKYQPERDGKNPATQEKTTVPEKVRLTFRFGEMFKRIAGDRFEELRKRYK